MHTPSASGARFLVRGLVTVALLVALAVMSSHSGQIHKRTVSLDSFYSGRGLLWLTGYAAQSDDANQTSPIEPPLAFNENVRYF